MIPRVEKMIKKHAHDGNTFEYRVIYPSKNPAAKVNGNVLKNILKLFRKPILNDSSLV